MARHGIWLTQKRAGQTSFEMVKAVTDQLGPSTKACHAGALDPFATGLVVVLFGQATRLFHHLHVLPKHYQCEVRWGLETDNLDLTGREVATADARHLTPESLDAALQSFVGWHDQVPPAYSNKRVGGERAWRLAQQGETVSLPAEQVYLHQARWVSHDLPHTSRLELVTRGGFYVRSLVRDVALKLGTRAHVSALHRPRIGPFEGEGERTLEEALCWCPTLTLTDASLGELRQTSRQPGGSIAPPTWPAPYELNPPLVAKHQHRPVALLRNAEVITWLEPPPRQP